MFCLATGFFLCLTMIHHSCTTPNTENDTLGAQAGLNSGLHKLPALSACAAAKRAAGPAMNSA